MEDEAPSEEELQEQDARQAAAAKGIDDNGSAEAIAMDKAGLIDLNDPEKLDKVETYVEATVGAAAMLAEKQENESAVTEGAAQRFRRNTDENSKDSKSFVTDLVANLDEAVEVLDEQEKLGVKSEDLLQKTLESAENAPITNSNLEKLKIAGVEDKKALQSLISEPANSDEAAEFIDDALAVNTDTGSDVATTTIKLEAVARSTSVADKMKVAKDDGVDPETIIDSAVAVAEIEKQAEEEQAALVSSGTEIDSSLIDQINTAANEEKLLDILEGLENEPFYDKLLALKASRVKVLDANRKKTKITTTIKAADSRNKSIATKKQEAEKLKGGIPAEVISALDGADLSSGEKVTALKTQYDDQFKSDITTLNAINDYIDKLKSTYDLENKKLTSFVEDVDTLETIFTATANDVNFDISDSLIQIEVVAETFELLETEDGDIDLEAAANLASSAKDIQESKKAITTAKEAGIDVTNVAKKDIKEQKAINKAVEGQQNAVEEKRKAAEQLKGDLSQTLIAILESADISTAENVAALKAQYANDPQQNVIVDFIDNLKSSYDLENKDLTSFVENSNALAVIFEATSGNEEFDISDSLTKIEDVAETLELLESEDGSVDLEAAANLAANAAEIEESKKAIELAKDAGIDVTEIAKKDLEEQKAINNIAEKLEEAGGADAAKNFLASGAADDALQYEKALEEDPDLANDIAIAVNDTAAGVGESGVSTLDLKAKIEEKVTESASGKLENEYAGTDFLSIIQSNKDRAQDIAFALSFVDKGSEQEKALFANVDKLDSIMNLGRRFEDDSVNLNVVFNNLDYANALSDLVNEFKNFPSRVILVMENPELSPAILSAYTDFKASGSTTLINDLFASTESMKSTLSNDGINKLRQDYPTYESEILAYEDRAGEIKSLLEQMNGDETREKYVLENLADFDTIRGLATRFQNSEDKLVVIFSYQGNLNELKVISDEIEAANALGGQDFLFEHLDNVNIIGDEVSQIETLIELGEQYNNQPESMDIIFANPEKAGQLRDLVEQLDSFKSDLLTNMNQLDVIEDLVVDYGGDLNKMDVVFRYSSKVSKLRDLNDDPDFEGRSDDLLSNIENLESFENDPRLLDLAVSNPDFFKLLLLVGNGLDFKPEDIEFDLLIQLVDLSLTRDELEKVLSDLKTGPDSEGPSEQPPGDNGLEDDFEAVSLLESHSFAGEIPSDLVLNGDKIRASSLFQETLDIFEALSAMDEHSNASSSESSSSTSVAELPMGIIGGVNLKFSSGNYDLSDLGYLSYAIAASESLTIEGSLYFSSTFNNLDELLFISADTISVAEGTTVDFRGRALGLGSFDTIDILNVDLYAEEDIGIRSLDSIVINNSDFATRGTGADFVHLMAAANIELNNLRFSEHIKQITMDAMTINLRNINFPAGSTVNLNSSYGGVDGVYPNFGSSAVGRVNFIENVKYNSHLLNTRSAFDSFGSSITIGVSGN